MTTAKYESMILKTVSNLYSDRNVDKINFILTLGVNMSTPLQVEIIEKSFFLEPYLSKDLYQIIIGSLIGAIPTMLITHISNHKNRYYNRIDPLIDLQKIIFNFKDTIVEMFNDMKIGGNNLDLFIDKLLEIEQESLKLSYRCLPWLLRHEFSLKFIYINHVINRYKRNNLRHDQHTSLIIAIEFICLNSFNMIESEKSMIFIIRLSKQLYRLVKDGYNGGVNPKAAL